MGGGTNGGKELGTTLGVAMVGGGETVKCGSEEDWQLHKTFFLLSCSTLAVSELWVWSRWVAGCGSWLTWWQSQTRCALHTASCRVLAVRCAARSVRATCIAVLKPWYILRWAY